MEQLTDIFGSMATLAVAGLVISELAEKLGWNLQGAWAQVRAVVATLLLGTVGALLQLGMFAIPETCGVYAWYICGPVIGAVAGLGANFAFMTPIGQAVLEFLKLRPVLKKPVEDTAVHSDAPVPPTV